MSELIKVMKDGEVIEIHPLALADHQKLGWVIWDEAAQAAAERTAVEEQAVADAKAATEKAVADAKAAEAKAAADVKEKTDKATQKKVSAAGKG